MSTPFSYFPTSLLLFEVIGQRADQLLHGQVTNTVKNLPLHRGGHHLFLNQKGKVQAELFIAKMAQSFYTFIPAFLSTVFISHLEKLAPLSRCQIKAHDSYQSFHVVGASDLFPALELFECTIFQYEELDVILFRSDQFGVLGTEVFVPTNQVEAFLRLLSEKSCSLLTPEDVHLLRVKNFVPLVGVDVDTNHLPQEAGLIQLIDFKKGCYLGQEVIARLHYRGHVNKSLCLFSSTEKDFHSQQIVSASDEEVGNITSMAFDPNHQVTWLMGYLPLKLQQKEIGFFVDQKKIMFQKSKVALS